MYQFPGATVTKYPKLGGFKQQELILSWLSRIEAQSQGVGRAALFPTVLRDDASSPFQLLEAASDPSVPGLVVTSLHSLPPSPRGLFFCVRLFLSCLVNTAVILDQGPSHPSVTSSSLITSSMTLFLNKVTF